MNVQTLPLPICHDNCHVIVVGLCQKFICIIITENKESPVYNMLNCQLCNRATVDTRATDLALKIGYGVEVVAKSYSERESE